MWATCCNWFCLDGQPEEAPPAQGARTQAYSNPGYSSFPSPTGSEPSCKACGTHFANTARKQTCLDCKKNFCMTCSSQVGSGPRLCLLCQRVRATGFQRDELMKVKVKDLRDYLSLHDISTEMCREKEELVLLVLGQQPVISQEGRTRGPTLSPDFPEQQAFLTPPHASTVPPTSASLPSSPAQAASVSPAQAQESQQANGHVSQDQEEPVYLESTARAPAEDETQSVDSEDSFVPGRRASLSDLTDLEDIEGLTVRQLKEILARNFVNYKGCCEKWELMERVTRLYKDQKGLQHLVCGAEDQNGGVVPPSVEENLCRICMDSPIDCVLLECGHMVTCTKCGKRMNECPICRQYVIRAVHVFRS
ncbi:E3 ubiquitin-protein ligase rififylin isoform X1 [Ursus arctos]|uniref:E3 ubiquitin-protein ligase rififylin isoform X1 n=1 Tax=Ursus arctos TaxID=9644 RepID=UPI002016D282|nr:E3 ubiquitin-protein ligase rififylin isoform X1 [Ursus arctos]XP_044246747.2 E3 ubiquitin-protein ligase rififylin isoform X1 [Ursus arctos]XP_044246748.2 E3 ubiquitin-protein ligase rififylin isoform X1 [Ursus arctos]XP_048079810.1 E3 ubiquitin-protein ligase rififylin isoform X1 [Ursus arctos]XP_057173795.1 E3 ubiquitin-protein ligase rififylin isoform X1 [Ursus arctos]XP_057173796.1 E3 ubiquitin-protein ligase rififylin isoform X1 [Ursus arctos]